METLTEQILKKMGMQQESDLFGKTTELLTLLHSRCTNSSLQINEYCKIVLCLDLAANMLGRTIDKDIALQLSGLRKSAYAIKKRMFQKLLDIERVVGVNDICTQLNLNELSKKSQEIFELYKSIVARERDDVDMSHPQYAAMAVYQACKVHKKKVSKVKIQSFSNLRAAQWSQLERRWDQFLAKYQQDLISDKPHENIVKKTCAKTVDKPNLNENKTEKSETSMVEDYENWKNRMIKEAERRLGR